MPLPLGHAAIGLTFYDVSCRDNSALSGWKVAVYVAVLANLPDIDVLIGLIFQGNGNAFHRGATHSLFFALVMGFLASIACRLWSQIPKMSFVKCFLIILSHVLADFFLTSLQVSLFWPFEVNWNTGYSGWGDAMNSVFLQVFRDAGIIVGCGMIVILNRLVRRYPDAIITVANALRRRWEEALK